MIKLTHDLAALTGLSILSVEKLVEKADYAICHAVQEAQLDKSNTAEIDIGIGILYIRLEADSIKYKFIPSDKLESNVRATVLYKESLLTHKLEESLKHRIERSYKELL